MTSRLLNVWTIVKKLLASQPTSMELTRHLKIGGTSSDARKSSDGMVEQCGNSNSNENQEEEFEEDKENAKTPSSTKIVTNSVDDLHLAKKSKKTKRQKITRRREEYVVRKL